MKKWNEKIFLYNIVGFCHTNSCDLLRVYITQEVGPHGCKSNVPKLYTYSIISYHFLIQINGRSEGFGIDKLTYAVIKSSLRFAARIVSDSM